MSGARSNDRLLEASPLGGCVFCGYNGEGYYQMGTHHLSCPWFNVGGQRERSIALASMIRATWDRMVQAEADRWPCPECDATCPHGTGAREQAQPVDWIAERRADAQHAADAALPPTEDYKPAPVIGRTLDEIVAGFNAASALALPDLPDGLTVREWAEERHANSVRLAGNAIGEARTGWLEDAAYWAAIVDVLRGADAALPPLPEGWESYPFHDLVAGDTVRFRRDDPDAIVGVTAYDDSVEFEDFSGVFEPDEMSDWLIVLRHAQAAQAKLAKEQAK